MSFDARHPDARSPAIPTQAAAAHLAAAKLRPDVLHKVGETYAMALSRLQSQLSADASPARVQAALAEVARLEQLGVQIQEIARVLAGEGQWVSESVDLAAAARQAVAGWADQAALAGAVLQAPQGRFEVVLNPAVIEQLLELALEYALHFAQRVVLRCAEEGNPSGPVLTLAITRSPGHREADRADDVNDLQWLLFVTLARASGMVPQRQIVGELVHIRLALGEPDAAELRSAALLPNTPVAVGRRVLLVDPSETSRVEAQRLLHGVGMVVDAAAGVEQARLGLQSAPHWPDVLVTGVAADAKGCAELIDVLRARQPHLRVVELVDDDSAFAFSVPGTDLPARVGRRTLPRTLVTAISQELDAA